VVHQHVIIGFLDFLFFNFSCSQIWLNPLVADCHFWSNMRKLEKKKKTLITGFPIALGALEIYINNNNSNL
jgi:hypothetical protein